MWIDPNTQTVYSSHEAIRRAFPNTSFPADMPADAIAFVGLQPVVAVEPPAFNPVFQGRRELSPALDGDVWTQQWEVYSLDSPEVEEKRQAARAVAWERIKRLRDIKAQEGGYFVENKWFHSDRDSRIQHLGLTIAGNGIPPGLQWKTMDGAFVEMTPAKARKIFEAAMAQDTALFAHAEALKAAVDAANDPNSIDIEAGWPATFEG